MSDWIIDPLVSQEAYHQRIAIDMLNKRDNFLTNRIKELQDALIELQSSVGNAATRLDSLPTSYSATQTRPRVDVRQAFIDGEATGEGEI